MALFSSFEPKSTYTRGEFFCKVAVVLRYSKFYNKGICDWFVHIKSNSLKSFLTVVTTSSSYRTQLEGHGARG